MLLSLPRPHPLIESIPKHSLHCLLSLNNFVNYIFSLCWILLINSTLISSWHRPLVRKTFSQYIISLSWSSEWFVNIRWTKYLRLETTDALHSQFDCSFCLLLRGAKQNIEKKWDVVKSNRVLKKFIQLSKTLVGQILSFLT